MSCDTLTSSTVRMDVNMGALPEGFCPETMQELADAFATRLIVTPNQNFTSFAAGSVAPTSNVGPWFKDCATWFVWDDATASYVPMTKEGFTDQQYFTASQAFVVPDFIYKIRVTAWGAGGGGGNQGAGSSGAGGAGGGFGVKTISVTPGENIVMVIGSGGTNGATGTTGGNTTITSNAGLEMTAGGGTGGAGSGSPLQSIGGAVTGADYSQTGGSSAGAYNGAKDGGDAGGWGGKGGAIGNLLPERVGIVPGGGGAGGQLSAPSDLGGPGGGGAVMIEY